LDGIVAIGLGLLVAVEITIGLAIDIPDISIGLAIAIPDISTGLAIDIPDISTGLSIDIPDISIGLSIDIPDISIGLARDIPDISCKLGISCMSGISVILGMLWRVGNSNRGAAGVTATYPTVLVTVTYRIPYCGTTGSGAKSTSAILQYPSARSEVNEALIWS
jgi:hypothetical protein